MMAARRFTAFVVGLAALAAAPAAHALDYLSLAEAAPAYDAPSAKARPLFVVLAGTPVELVVGLDGWSKVRDSRGELVWIEKKHLTDKRNVIVRVDRAQVRAAAAARLTALWARIADMIREVTSANASHVGWMKIVARLTELQDMCGEVKK